jgi:DNA repair protein RecN (Recombination protein N)
VDRLGSEIAAALNHLDPEVPAAAQEAEGAVAALRISARLLAGAAAIDSSLQHVSSRLDELQILLDDAVLDVKRYASELEADPARLEDVADRIARLKDLKRKYGATLDEVLAYRESAAAELMRLSGAEFDEAALRDREQVLMAEVVEIGSTLTEMRRRSARNLAQAAQSAIADLQLGNATFSIDVSPRDGGDGDLGRFDETGFDTIEFQFAPNAGESPRPLARIASGGEMARVMLALKAVMAAADSIPTLVFDEVDVGVGGRSGSTVGEKLRGLARDRQVLVISHLPQVAGQADRHLRIRKEEDGGRTFSILDELGEGERIEELAAMLDGEPVTEASRAKAIEMLHRIRADEGVAP